MKKYLCFIFTLISALPIYAQSDYYVRGDMLVMGGLSIVDQGEKNNAISCKAQIQDSIRIFTPNEVTEYGMNGQKYFSKSIEIDGKLQKFFLLRLNSESPFVYYFAGHQRNSFFVEKKNDRLIELSENNYRQVIEDCTAHCQTNKEKLKNLSYSKLAFERYFSSTDFCKTDHIAYFKWGVLVGGEVSRLSLKSSLNNNALNNFDYTPTLDALLGIFVDYPLSTTNFSIHSELSVAKNRFRYSTKQGSSDYDLVVNATSISLPVLLRYTTTFRSFFPFVNGGLMYGNIIRNKGLLSVAYTNTSTSVIDINHTNSDQFITSHQIGIAIGAGAEYRLNYKHSLSVEIRYLIHTGLSSANDIISNHLQFLLSYNI
ncbi:MAG: porin family protein [Bacteroidota bacterium]|nr:porin family protein [Bacteroidota bacterium]